MERGHSEDEGPSTSGDVLNEAAEVDGAGEPGKESALTRAAKSFLSALTGSDGDDSTTPDAPVDEATRSKAEAIQSPAEAAASTKEGRTLSTANRHSLMASIDAAADVLEDAGVDHGIERFTDREAFDFDLSDHDAREWPKPEDEEEEDEEGVSPMNNAAGGDTPADSGGSTSADDTPMSNDNGGDGKSDGGDDKSLAEENAEQIKELSESIESLTRALTGEEKTVEIEIDGETHEVPKSQAKAALGIEDGDPSGAENRDRVAELEARLDAIKRQSGVGGSTQIEASADGDDEGDWMSWRTR